MSRRFLRWVLVATVSATGASALAGTVLLDAAVYPEGPLWRDGKLLYVEYAGPGVKVWADGKAVAFWSSEHCGASGLIGYREDHLLVACYDSNSLVELDREGKTVRTIDTDSTGKPFVGPNDFAADSGGGIYISASGAFDVKAPISGALLYLPPGAGAPRPLADLIHYPNGLTLARDGKTLLVAEMLAGRILSFPVNDDGSLGARTVWARMQDLAKPSPRDDAYNGPDGLKLGPDGNYYIAQNGSGRVLVVDAGKKLVRTLLVPTPYVTNMSFGANGADTVYITGVFDPWKPPFPGAVYRWTR